ncbi:hypothetical protein LPJ61_004812 [Coemansia biformis]|uniref:Uncharacterized protein n=1 Tax=Coemansia biformis TaxID=1286918 RepID=A0A9W8CX79_9FUNG|nr:hypothetical protein LPJ61_004812 [Coemansia biformis]
MTGSPQTAPAPGTAHDEPARAWPDPVDRLRRRNQRAVRFLSSIATSSAALEDTAWAARDSARAEGGPPDAYVSGNAGQRYTAPDAEYSSGTQARQHVRCCSLGEDPRGRPEPHPRPAGMPAELQNRPHSDANEGAGTGSVSALEWRYSRKASQAPQSTAEPSDTFGGEPDGEPALARPAPSFPIAFASIKPFIGKGDDRGHRSGAGNSRPEAERAVEGADGSTCRAGALDDAELQSGLHRAVAGLTEYVGTILENVRADDQRQDGADRARDAHLDGVAGRPTAEQIRRLRALMLRIAREQDLELSTAAIGWVYFEKLLLKGHVVKGNRKLVAGK